MSTHNEKSINRRDFLKVGGMSTAAVTLGATGLLSFGTAQQVLAKPRNSKPSFSGYGPLVKDPNGILNLPRGFKYQMISNEGDKLSNGARIPANFDGMASFPGKHHSTILVRNHELGENSNLPVEGKNPYRKDVCGGTTALIVGPNNKVLDEYVTSSGTIRNCAGGGTPWGTWLTCEETLEFGHGYVFEVDPHDPENKLSKTPIKEMGAFSHEACDVDPSTGIVYLTEDQWGQSFFYRYIPNDPQPKPGALQKGGRLQAAAIEENPNADIDGFNPGQTFGLVWKDVDPEKANLDADAKGCLKFFRLEGSYFKGGAFWFSDTGAGEKGLGQIYRYIPATNTLELFYEGSSASNMQSPDNICITPWGDLWFVEDGDGQDRIMGITPEGGAYEFGKNVLNGSELAGPCFSTDGNTFFVNIQNPGITFAITGPFARRNSGRQRHMAHANPPQQLAPKMSDKLMAFAEREGMSQLEAAAFHRHGMPII
ncbi:alkaline phosphatase PhoX [Salinibacillus xinjiangensis]|uniref:DUF839 domain-containing protein n=1 Tax=Salinibacillus xinjiangensis TaxID=1229268 RepID=A0A6G1XAN4_9BACI|nr:alkaline phosphatase PhoX [Salinibacillus xinjiangensis]MRG88073.1 DUF839 domain-containing protein [Salinibacillus xinjiangensis]